MRKEWNLCKKAIAMLLTIPLLVSTVSPALSVSAETDAVVINKTSMISFENGELPDGVSIISSNATVVAAPATGHGDYSLEHVGAGAQKDLLQINHPLKAGHTYEIRRSHYFATDDTSITTNPWFAFCWYTATGGYGGNFLADSNGVAYGTWETATIQFTPTQDVSRLRLVLNAPEGVMGYFDDITIVDVTTPEEMTYLATGFADIETVEGMPLLAGSNASITYKNDADKGIVAECNLGQGINASKMAYLPYVLKANTTYEITMTYKSNNWSTWCLTATNGNIGSGLSAASSWTTVTRQLTVPEDVESTYFGLGTTLANTQITIASIRLTEIKANSTDYQMYDFDAYPLSKATTTTIAGANGVDNTVFHLTNSSVTTQLDCSLTANEKYKLSFDYKGAGTLRLTGCILTWSNTQEIATNKPITPYLEVRGSYVALNSASQWSRYEVIYTTGADHNGLYFNNQLQSFANDHDITSSEFYFDNICIEKLTACTAALTEGENGTAKLSAEHQYVGEKATYTATPDIGYVFVGWKDVDTDVIISTSSVYEHILTGDINLKPVFELSDKADYHEDFEGASESSLLSNIDLITVSSAEEPGYGKVAKIDFANGVGYNSHFAKIPYLCLAGIDYRIQITYKLENDSTVGFVKNDINNVQQWLTGTGEWVTTTWYINETDTDTILSFVSNHATTLYIADISIEYGRDAAGDVNNNGVCDGTDRELLAKVLVGSVGENDNKVFKPYLDVNEDTERNIKDIVRLKTIIHNTPSTTLVDECANLTTAVCSANIAVETDDKLGDNSRFRIAASEQDAFVIYQVDGGITEAAVQYDFPEKYYTEGDFIFEVSSDMLHWKRVYPQDVAADVITEHGWTLRTSYFANLGFMPFFRITYPTGYPVTSSPGIRKVQFNGLDEEALVSMNGYNSELREAATLYVDSQNGDDQNSGLSTEEALKTLRAVAEKNLVPGDKILLKSGEQYQGGVTLLCSGTKENPILISSYGEGEKPIVNDFGNGVGIRITGDYIHIENLTFSCEEGYAGLDIYAVAGGASKGLCVRGCEFSDINSTIGSTSKSKYLSGGLHFIARGNQPTWFEGIRVEDNTFERVARTAIYVTSFWAARDTENQTTQNLNFGISEAGIPTEYLSTDVKIRDNTIQDNGGDAIMLNGVDGALVEYNVVTDTKLLHQYPLSSSATEIWDPAFAAIWCYCSDNVVFQYNEVSGTSGDNGGHDLQAFDIDFSSNNCVVQYNYSYNNEGGFVLLAAEDASSNGQVENTIVRYNLSVNDGGSRVNPPLSVFDITGSILNTHIYNNTIYCGNNNVRLINFSNYVNATTKSTTLVENNIFYASEEGKATWGYGDANTRPAFASATFNNNILYNINEPSYAGTDADLSVSGTLQDNPKLVSAGTVGAGRLTVGEAYKLEPGSPAISGGKIIENNGGLIGAFGLKED